MGLAVAVMVSFPGGGFAAGIGTPDAPTIMQQSLSVIRADWRKGASFADVERDQDLKDGQTTSKTYSIMMIDGSPYKRLIAEDGHELPNDEAAKQEEQYRRECTKRANESSQQRADRLSSYHKSQEREFDMMRNMTQALDFEITGEETVDGHPVYVLHARPRPGYEPQTREGKILTGMEGKLWIDKQTYRWVKVQAEVTKPVMFGGFLAKVYPGTQFLLEQAPVTGGIWMPDHFAMTVNASVLFCHKGYTHDETYRDYHASSGKTDEPKTMSKVN
jgi:hypothetical protein